MTRSRGDSVVSIKLMINNVTRFRWFIFILSNIAIFSICVGLNSFSLTVVAMIGKEHEHTVDSVNSTIPKIVNSTLNSTVDSTNDVTITPFKSSGSVHVNWSNVDKSRVLAASFWGILVMSLFGGRICELYGPRKVVTLTLLANGLVTLLFPTIAIRSFAGAYFIRIINGICTGIILPSCNVVVSRWALTSERTLSSSVVTSGSIFANLVSLSLAGILVDSGFLGGWPSVFYLFGTFNLIIAIIYYIIVYDTPEDHPYLGAEELELILKNRSVSSGGSVKVPWVKMFTSIPVIAYLIPAFTYGWVVGAVIAQMPSFYEDVLEFSHTSNGFVASLPWLVGIGAQLSGSAITDRVRKTNRFSLTAIRKVVTVLSLGTCSFGLVAITLLGKRKVLVVLTLAIAKGMGTLSDAGVAVNHLDIAPSFAGTLSGFYSVMASIASLIANEAAAQIVGKNPSQQNWYLFFYISSALNVAGVIMFCLLGSGEVQSWDPASSNNRQNVKLEAQNDQENTKENSDSRTGRSIGFAL